MPIEQDIDAFYVWATKLGCPQEALPSEDALKSIFKSRQRDLFCNMMKRVRPKEEVQAIRENILIKKMSEFRNQIVPVCNRSYLPKEFQTYLKVKDLQKKEKELEDRVDEKRKEFDKLAASVKTKNIRIVDLKNKRDILQAKCDLLDFKLEDLNNNIKTEEQNKIKILENMPVQITTKNAKEQIAMDAVSKAHHELQEFYKNYENQSAATQQLMRNHLWEKIRKIFANIPNYFIFNAIMRLKEENLQCIMNLRNSKLDATKLHHSGGNTSHMSKEPFTQFEEKFLQTKAELLGVIAQYHAAKSQLINTDYEFEPVYNAFVDELKKKLSMFNCDIKDDTEIDCIITQYLIQLNSRTFQKTKNEFLTQQIEQYKMVIENCAKQLENHDVLLGTIKQVYSDINESINRIHMDMMQLKQVKEKIVYTKNLMLNHIMLQNSNVSTTGTANALGVPKMKTCNTSILGQESFSIGNDCVLSSTKLDFDATINPLSTTMLSRSFSNADLTLVPAAAGPSSTIPPHLLELMTFHETPLQKFSCIPKELAFYLSPNPLIVESTELTSTLQLAPGILLTPFGALQEVQKNIKWAELIAAHSNDLKLDLDLITVDANAFKQRIKQQRECITELLDKTDITCANTNHMLRKLAKYYDFILENPLRHYIPATKCFSNQTFADFEAEYLMYYRMATVGTSITTSSKK